MTQQDSGLTQDKTPGPGEFVQVGGDTDDWADRSLHGAHELAQARGTDRLASGPTSSALAGALVYL
jgi:hypothetical protein